MIRTNALPKDHFEGRWKKDKKYTLYAVVVNNGTKFRSITPKKKDEPYVIYDSTNETFSANSGWEIVEMSEDSRLSAMGGNGGGASGQDGKDAGFGTITASVSNTGGTPSVEVNTSGPNTAKNISFAFHNLKGAQGAPGVSNADIKVVDTLPEASSQTTGRIYLVETETAGTYARWYTEVDGTTYTWRHLGTTAVALDDYATKTEVSQLEAESTDLRTDVGEKQSSVIRHNIATPESGFLSGYAMVAESSNANFGKSTNSTNYSISPYIDISAYAGKVMKFTNVVVTVATTQYGLVFYTGTTVASAISPGVLLITGGEEAGYELVEVTIPANAVNVRFTARTAFLEHFEAYVEETIEGQFVSGLGKDVADLQDELTELGGILQKSTTSFDLTDPDNIVSGSFIQYNGVPATYSGGGALYSNPIHLEKGCKITMHGRGASANVAMISRYNGDGQNYTPLVLSDGMTAHDYDYTATDDIYVAVSCLTDRPYYCNYEKLGLTEKVENINGELSAITEDVQELEEKVGEIDYTKMLKDMAGIGDSLMSGTIIDGNISGICYDSSWLAFLSRLNGAKWACYSTGGLTTKSWLNSQYRQNFDALSVIPDSVFIGLGTNDSQHQDTIPTGQVSDVAGTNSFCGYYKQIIELVHTKCPNAKVFCLSLYRPTSLSATEDNYTELIRQMSALYDYCTFIDIAANITFDRSANNVYAASSHYTTIGYLLVARLVHQLLNDSIKTNRASYKFFGLYTKQV